MANRRMFSNQIINSARFLQMPATTRLLYYDLGMKADDEGFVEAFSVLRMTRASEDDLRLLDAKGYIKIINDDLAAYIFDWEVNNQIRKDRFQESIYHNLIPEITRPETNGKPTGNQMATKAKPAVSTSETSGCRSIVEDSVGKVSKGKDSLVQKSKNPAMQIPTLDDVIAYAESRGRVDLAETFFDYYNAADWHDQSGAKVRNWKQKFITWEQRTPKPEKKEQKKKNDPYAFPDWDDDSLFLN